MLLDIVHGKGGHPTEGSPVKKASAKKVEQEDDLEWSSPLEEHEKREGR
jgi:hypothetical protein